MNLFTLYSESPVYLINLVKIAFTGKLLLFAEFILFPHLCINIFEFRILICLI